MTQLTVSQKCFLAAAVLGAIAQRLFTSGSILRLVESGDVDELAQAKPTDRQQSYSAREYFL
jgi:hypothetical protein